MVLTQHGHRFQASARKVLSAVAEAGMVDHDRTETLSGNLDLGVTSLVAGYYLAELFARFRAFAPLGADSGGGGLAALPRAPADQRRARPGDHGHQRARRPAGAGGRGADALAQPRLDGRRAIRLADQRRR